MTNESKTDAEMLKDVVGDNFVTTTVYIVMDNLGSNIDVFSDYILAANFADALEADGFGEYCVSPVQMYSIKH